MKKVTVLTNVTFMNGSKTANNDTGGLRVTGINWRMLMTQTVYVIYYDSVVSGKNSMELHQNTERWSPEENEEAACRAWRNLRANENVTHGSFHKVDIDSGAITNIAEF